MRRSFSPAVESLDSIVSLSALGHGPVAHHKPVAAHVHHSAVQTPPHQWTKFWGTGDIVKGSMSGTSFVDGDSTLITAKGTVTVFGASHPDSTIYLNVTGKSATFSIQTDAGWIFGKAAYAPEWTESSGWHYNTTGGTNEFASINGTGYLGISGSGSNVSVSINPHQPTA